MAPERCDKRIESLIVRLRGTDECWSYEKIANHVGLSRRGVQIIYERVKNPKPINKRGKRRSTDNRTDRPIVTKTKENPKLTATEIWEKLSLKNISVLTVQCRLNWNHFQNWFIISGFITNCPSVLVDL